MQSRVAYGIQAVRKALARGLVERLYVVDGLGAKRLGRLAGDIERSSAPVVVAAPQELQRLTGTDKHQGVAALVRGASTLSEREAIERVSRVATPLVLALDSIQDPRNFGSLLRTADAAGVDLVVAGRSRNVGITPAVSKVASGAAEVQPFAEVGNLARFLVSLSDLGVQVIGTEEAAPRSLFELELCGPVALVFGAEGQGMRRLTRERCDALVRLPMNGVVESLNVAVAAGICLYECLRQRSRLAPPGALG
jgi:23S rRNA (guanosine2251-2'-O)-methyltransferase